jgi:hypothetical protein
MVTRWAPAGRSPVACAPRHRANDGTVRVNVDLSEIQYEVQASPPRGGRADLKARIEQLQASRDAGNLGQCATFSIWADDGGFHLPKGCVRLGACVCQAHQRRLSAFRNVDLRGVDA